MGLAVSDHIKELDETLGEALIRPTKIYTEACEVVLADLSVSGIIHITGGGFFENIPRIIPEGLGVEIMLDTWEIPPILKYIQKYGEIDRDEMFATFNMGVGMIMIHWRSGCI